VQKSRNDGVRNIHVNDVVAPVTLLQSLQRPTSKPIHFMDHFPGFQMASTPACEQFGERDQLAPYLPFMGDRREFAQELPNPF
jgi:hypothetical protein